MQLNGLLHGARLLGHVDFPRSEVLGPDASEDAIQDLIDRGLYERTLIVAMGEFGRTPRMNANAGRDHWGNTFSVLFGGGGLKMGQTIGRSSPRGEHVVDRPFDPQDIAATIYHHLGIDARSVSFRDHLDRPMALLDRGEPIRELL